MRGHHVQPHCDRLIRRCNLHSTPSRSCRPWGRKEHHLFEPGTTRLGTVTGEQHLEATPPSVSTEFRPRRTDRRPDLDWSDDELCQTKGRLCMQQGAMFGIRICLGGACKGIQRCATASHATYLNPRAPLLPPLLLLLRRRHLLFHLLLSSDPTPFIA